MYLHRFCWYHQYLSCKSWIVHVLLFQRDLSISKYLNHVGNSHVLIDTRPYLCHPYWSTWCKHYYQFQQTVRFPYEHKQATLDVERKRENFRGWMNLSLLSAWQNVMSKWVNNRINIIIDRIRWLPTPSSSSSSGSEKEIDWFTRMSV